MNAKVIGNSMAVITTITLDEIKKLQAEKPEALCLYEGEGKEKKMVFRVEAGSTACISKLGICFNAETNTEPKFAMVNVDISDKPEDANVKEFVAKKYGKALKMLGKLEEGFGGALATVKAEAEELASLITISL